MYVLSRFSHVWLFVTPWTVAHRVLCPWDSPGKNTGGSGLPCHSPGDLSNTMIEPEFPEALAG